MTTRERQVNDLRVRVLDNSGFGAIAARDQLIGMGESLTPWLDSPELGEGINSFLDFGLVVVGEIDKDKKQIYSKVSISEYGVIAPDPSQVKKFQEAYLSNAELELMTPALLPFANVGDVYYCAFPSKILNWASKFGYENGGTHPDTLEKNPSPYFDRDHKTYNPDPEVLEAQGYSPLGIKRQQMLSLMTHVIANSVDSQRVLIRSEECEITVILDKDDALKLDKNYGLVQGFMFSLDGVKLVFEGEKGDKVTKPLSSIRNFKGDQGIALENVVAICAEEFEKDKYQSQRMSSAVTPAINKFYGR